MTDSRVCCATCTFHDHAAGECRRDPPMVAWVTSAAPPAYKGQLWVEALGWQTAWPRTRHAHWCGQWSPESNESEEEDTP